MSYSNRHTPVLLSSVLNSSKPEDINISVVFDATFGGGGYSLEYLKKGCVVHANDLDRTALDVAESDEVFQYYLTNNKLFLHNGNFSENILTFPDSFFDFIVADLGYSTNQLYSSGRGFSYQQTQEILDLRYDATIGKSCSELLLCVKTVDKLSKTLFNFSGESHSRRIAQNIFDLVQKKKRLGGQEEIYVGEVVECVVSIPIPSNKRNGVLSRVWQSLRIWTNNEFDELIKFLEFGVTKLKPGGRMLIVTFHSLEDKIVTKFMRSISKSVPIDDFGNKKSEFTLVTKNPIEPTEEEVSANPQSRSGRLRVLEKN